ncbi:MAG TPA: winged helix-turn-helix domain-containing protein [Candidatus Baltobacteraceae bacterium]|nr:winged helix-turn-helix domain-containing protein [Candidatus Baltobacteraceae bacterium]
MNAQSPLPAERVPLGRYSFDREASQLYAGTRRVPLPPKACALLAFLVANRGRLVSRDEIMQTLWPSGFVQDGNLTQTIYLLRKALADEPRVRIQNLPRRGYRLQIEMPERRRSPLPFATAAALLLALALIDPGMRNPMPPAAQQAYRLALYHLQRPDELTLSVKYFFQVERIAPRAPQGYAGAAIVDAMYAADANRHAASCASGTAAADASFSKGSSALGHTARALLEFMCNRSANAAEREISRALDQEPQNPVVLNVAARLALWSGDTRQAVADARQAVALQPDSPEAISTLALAEYYDGQFVSAADNLRRALEIVPNSAALQSYLTQSLKAAGLPAGTPREAVAHNGVSDPNARAAEDIARGHYREALAALDRLRSQDPVLAQLDWQSDYRFRALRQRFRAMDSRYVTFR